MPILVFLGLSDLELGPMYTTDRRQTKASHNKPLKLYIVHTHMQAHTPLAYIVPLSNVNIIHFFIFGQYNMYNMRMEKWHTFTYVASQKNTHRSCSIVTFTMMRAALRLVWACLLCQNADPYKTYITLLTDL